MPTHFVKIDESGREIMPFNRFHYNEATGERVPTKAEHNEDVFELTEQDAADLIAKWNQMCDLHYYDFSYEVYHEKV